MFPRRTSNRVLKISTASCLRPLLPSTPSRTKCGADKRGTTQALLHLRLLPDSQQELVEIRAAQRTFEGAYIRTALGQFSFSLVILKIFTSEFYSIGALFAIYGAGVLLISLFRRQQGNKQFFSEIGEDGLNQRKFRTSGNVVIILTALSIAAYACLLVLTLKLGG